MAKAAEESKEKWDYVTVRPGANMFWWLYYSTNDAAANDDVPLVIWLQVNGSVLVRPGSKIKEPLFGRSKIFLL